MNREQAVEGSVSLLGALPIDRALLGSSITIVLGVTPLSVVLPGPRLGGDWSTDLLPNWLFPAGAAEVADASPLVDQHDPGWGAVVGPTTPIAWVKRVHVRMNDDALDPPKEGRTTPDAPEGILGQLDAWRSNLLLWAEVVSRFPCRHRRPGVFLNSIPFWKETGPVVGPHFGSPVSIVPEGGDLITATEWAAITQAAVVGPPPITWRMVADARAFLAANDLRRAVIDAGVAIDVALSDALAQRFHDDAGPFESLLSQRILNQGLGTLIEAFQRTGGQFWRQDEMNTLKRARNAAAHDGEAPSREDAATSVGLAHDVVSELDPLLPHLQA